VFLIYGIIWPTVYGAATTDSVTTMLKRSTVITCLHLDTEQPVRQAVTLAFCQWIWIWFWSSQLAVSELTVTYVVVNELNFYVQNNIGKHPHALVGVTINGF